MPHPLLGVMALYLNGNLLEEKDYFRRLSEQGNRLGLDVMVFTPEDVSQDGRHIRAHLYDGKENRWIRRHMPFPALVYDRCRFQRTPRFAQLRQFRAKYPQLTYLNRPIAHKWGVYQTLAGDDAVKPHLPRTEKYRSEADLLRYLKEFPLVYLKPEDGTGGRGIIRIRRLEDGLFVLQGRDRSRRIVGPHKLKQEQIAARLRSWEMKDRYLIQQGISIALKDGRVHDYRLLIQKNGKGEWQVTGCAGRVGPAGSITSNLHGGGAAVPMRRLMRQRFGSETKIADIESTLGKLSHNVARRLEQHYGQLCELALDIAIDPQGGVWLLEVNPKPAREVFRRIGESETYRTAISRPLEYALWLHRGKFGGAKSGRRSRRQAVPIIAGIAKPKPGSGEK
ncbi:YheC/YheD family endospore coat-associated protein [Paenibacillus cymbidii]|uniref:YheC/YheD family endospore coat-associated protein n=1 Tax=Paenibacillus cymbidii TaxID=1639034 RepID=UPI0010818C9F|nr:YheC/YheD family protein [Paenibacillus cymbidii]